MVLRRVSLSVVLVLLSVGWPLSRAGATDLNAPPNIVIPNYDRTLVGQIPSLEAGAYAARVSDASANWYNPAGLVQAPKTAINASSSAYRWTGVKAEAGGQTTGATNGGQPPSFLGVVAAPPVLGNERLRYGFSITNETFWSPALQQQITTTLAGGQTRRVLFSARDEFVETIPAIAMAYALSDRLSVGVSICGDIVSFNTNDVISTQTTDAASHTLSTRTAEISAGATNLFAGVGAQYSLSDRWRLSLAAKTPSLRLFGSGTVTAEDQLNSGGQTSDVAFFDSDVTFKYSRPFQASIGAAFLSQSFELEVDLRYHAAIGPYPTLSSTVPITTTTSTGGGAPTVTTAPANDVVTEFRHILDMAIGSKYQLSDSVSLHAGYFRSSSPLKDGDSALFRRVDMNGITAGAALKLGQFSGSLGLAYEWGKSDPYSIPTATPGQTTLTTINLTTVSVLYALTFQF